MLISQQLPAEVLLEGLLEAYELPLRRLALAVFAEPAHVAGAVKEALAIALVERYDFRLGENVQAWFYRKAIRALREVVRRRERRGRLAAQPSLTNTWLALQESAWYVRIGCLLQGLLGWNTAEAIEVVGIPALAATRLVEAEIRQADGDAQRQAAPCWEKVFLQEWKEAEGELSQVENEALRQAALEAYARRLRNQMWRQWLRELTWLAPLAVFSWLLLL